MFYFISVLVTSVLRCGHTCKSQAQPKGRCPAGFVRGRRRPCSRSPKRTFGKALQRCPSASMSSQSNCRGALGGLWPFVMLEGDEGSAGSAQSRFRVPSLARSRSPAFSPADRGAKRGEVAGAT